MKIIHWFFRHKVSTLIIILLLGGVATVVYNKTIRTNEVVRYGIALVKRDTIISSVAGTGQVTSLDQLDVKSTVSGTIIGVDVLKGQRIEAGAIIARLDEKDATKAVRDAQVGVRSAQLALKKLKQPPDRLIVLQAQNALTQSNDAKQKAKEDIESARIAFQKMTQGPDELALLQAQNALTSSQEALGNTEDNLKKAREDGFNTVADAFLTFPTIMTGLNDMFYTSSIDRNQTNVDWYANQITRWDSEKVVQYKNDLTVGYALARKNYDANFDHYKSSSRSSDSKTLEALILETYETSKLISDVVKAANNYIDLVQNVLKQYNYPIPTIITTHKNTLITFTNQSNTSSSNLLSIKQEIENTKTSIVSSQRMIDDKTESLRKLKEGADPLDIQSQKIVIKQREDAIVATDRAIAEKAESLRKLKEGADLLDIQSQELTVVQRENALADAQEKLSEYVIHAPFSGEVAAVPVKVGDSISSATSVVTLITQQRIAELSLNEVDVAKVKLQQKVTLTFDAVQDMSISGAVSDIDTIGAVSQGVVTYIVKVGFDTQDERVKPGMSVSGSIITDVRQDVLVVPNSAIKTRNDSSYVDVPSESISGEQSQLTNVELKLPPRAVPISLGAANDTLTEIVSGLKEGDMIISKIIQQQVQPSQAQAPSLFGSQGGARGLNGGGAPGRTGR